MDLKQKKENEVKLVKSLQELAGVVRSENRAFSAEETEIVNRQKAELSALRAEVKTLEELHALDDIFNVKAEVSRSETSSDRYPSQDDHRKSFRGWLLNQWDKSGQDDSYKIAAARTGVDLDSPNYVVRNQTKGTNSQGGFLVPAPELGQIIEVMKAFGGMRENATYLNVADGRGLRYPVINDTSNVAGRLNELANVTTTALAFTDISVNVGTYRSAVMPVSRELLTDSAFPLEALIAKKLGERLARVVNTHATTHADFIGLTNGLTADAYTYTLANVDYEDLVKMKGKLDRAYDSGAKWMFNSSTLEDIALMVDDNDRPLWVPDLVNGVPGTILGKPYVINDDMTDDQIIYGSISDAYVMTEVGSPALEVLRERYLIENNAIGVVIFSRFGGRCVNPSAIKLFNRTVGE